MTCGEVMCSVCDYSKIFVKSYTNPNLDQQIIDAILVDFVNYFAMAECCSDLAMYTDDLRDGKKLSEYDAKLSKESIQDGFNHCRIKYDALGIEASINRNYHMNHCNGKAKVNNEEALKCIDAFIKGYIESIDKRN